MRAQVHHMHVRSEPGIVSQIPAGMIGVVVNDNWVARPDPIFAVLYIEGSYAERKAAEPESRRASANQAILVAGAKPSGEAPMLKGMGKMKARVVGGIVVAYPGIIRIYVRTVGMSRVIREILLWRRRLRALGRFPWLRRNRRALFGSTLFRCPLLGCLRALAEDRAGECVRRLPPAERRLFLFLFLFAAKIPQQTAPAVQPVLGGILSFHSPSKVMMRPQTLFVPQIPDRRHSSCTIWLWSTKRFTFGP